MRRAEIAEKNSESWIAPARQLPKNGRSVSIGTNPSKWIHYGILGAQQGQRLLGPIPESTLPSEKGGKHVERRSPTCY